MQHKILDENLAAVHKLEDAMDEKLGREFDRIFAALKADVAEMVELELFISDYH